MSERINPSEEFKAFHPTTRLQKYAEEWGVNISAGIPQDSGWTPELAELENGRSVQLYQSDGASYFFSQIDYLDNDEVMANRMIARIPPSQRTDLAYWSEDAAEQTLTAHRGRGYLVTCGQENKSLRIFELNADTQPEATLQPGVFYSLHGDRRTPEGLIVSSLYMPPIQNWENLETTIKPGDKWVRLPSKVLRIPDAFRSHYPKGS